MSTAELQLQLHQSIDAIVDGEKLEAIYTLLKGKNGPHEAMSTAEYVGTIDEARKQIKEGKYTSLETLESESESLVRHKKIVWSYKAKTSLKAHFDYIEQDSATAAIKGEIRNYQIYEWSFLFPREAST